MESIIRRLQNKELEMLIYFRDFCEKHNLKFYLCGGGLIGAIRHKGFIPWDDDLDVFMPREDYERLAVLWKKYADTKRYKYCRTDKNVNYHDAGASIRDENTTFINRHSINEDICHGLALEIMPIDGCPRGKFNRMLQLFYAMVFALFNVQRLPDNKGKLFRKIASFVYSVIPNKSVRYFIWKFAEKQMMRYKWDKVDEVTELIGSLKGMKLRHPKSDFEEVVYVSFEGERIPLMKGYDRYLRLIWGDYMKLPPEKDRKAKHDAVLIDMDKSYRFYKGKYYCIR